MGSHHFGDTNMKHTNKAIMAAVTLATLGWAQAAVTPEEARQLGTTLTPWGAEMAASKDGAIPAYAGGLPKDTSPPGFKPGSGKWPNPFNQDKPLYVITAKNMDEYADKLTETNKALLKRFPNYKLEVYPTRRSVNMPEYVKQGTIKNATRARILDKDGTQVDGIYGGLPFPIPKTGQEAMWNWALRYEGLASNSQPKTYLVDSSGRNQMIAWYTTDNQFPTYDPKMTEAEWKSRGSQTYNIWNDYKSPARLAGELNLYINNTSGENRGWIYSPGTRRVRIAPDLAYDTPCPGMSGAITFDDIRLFDGKLDRFNWKLVGKKEMLIPYNDYKLIYETTGDKAMTPNVLNPDVVRWELHRVWVVEGTVKPGVRHIYSKKVMYMDEDMGGGASDIYDQSGKLYRGGFQTTTPAWDDEVPLSYGTWQYDLTANNYVLVSHAGDPGTKGNVQRKTAYPANYFTPERLSASGVR
jgi:hypothetical protein